jgi:hypothetical protein
MPRNVLGNLPRRARALSKGLEGSGHGGHRADHPRRQQARKNLGSAIAVGEALGGAPVRLIHVFLHPPAVERTVRERVDGEDIDIVAVEKAAELAERGRRAQGFGRDRGQSQAQPERRPWGNLRLDLRHMGVKAGAHLVPRLTGVNVGAVGEMDVAGNTVETHHFSPKLS